MATHDIEIRGPDHLPESGVFFDRIGNQIAAANPIGNQLAEVLSDAGADRGWYDNFKVPQNYVGTPVIVLRGILDGAMTTVTAAIGVRGIVLADNAAADVAYSTEDLGNTAVDHADEDEVEILITLVNLVPVAGRMCYYHFFINADVNTYTGNILVTGLFFRFNDA